MILVCIKKERPGVAYVAPLFSTICMMVQRFFIIGCFSLSMPLNVWQVSQILTSVDCLKIAGMRWNSLFNWLQLKTPRILDSKTFNSFDISVLLMAFKCNYSTFLNFFNAGFSNQSLMTLMVAPRAWKYIGLK